ncbi:hypothetical protein [Solirubrobacter soli]|uniref:hypothetical protein n=1 Tax=Solirubrobacter soli TaxID=363832 RepID=UPI0012F79263|nr:hypothetical protein [Solirubrobacter soli]
MRALIFASLLVLCAAAPAHAADTADTALRTFDKTDIGTLDGYRDRVAWTEANGTLWTVEAGAAVQVDVKRVDGIDVAAGPDGRPVAVYERGSKFYLYDFAAKRERRIKSPGKVQNWAFWKDRFAVIRDGRLQIVPQGGKARDVGRAKSLAGNSIDFNGVGVAYVNEFIRDDEDVEEFELAYWPATGPGAGRIVMRVAHGASGDTSLAGAVLSPTKAYATQRGGEFGGPYRLWRVDLKSGKKHYAGLPAGANLAVPLGAEQAVAYVCPPEDDFDEDDAEQPCRLILRSVTWRR